MNVNSDVREMIAGSIVMIVVRAYPIAPNCKCGGFRCTDIARSACDDGRRIPWTPFRLRLRCTLIEFLAESLPNAGA
jgi:hypothetical protein